MDAIVLLFSKFSDELLALQASIVCGALALTLYWLLLRRRDRRKSEWVPAALVKQYLDRVDQDERDIRFKLFGETSGAAVATSTATTQQIVVSGSDPALAKELEALRAQLGFADKRAAEFERTIQAMLAEKAALEEKLRTAPAAGAQGASGVPAAEVAAIQNELNDLKSRLAEYEVIEDDLANLKKFQLENKVLKEKIEGYEKGTPAAAAPAPAPAPEAKPAVSGAAKLEAPVMTVIPGGAEASAAGAEKTAKQKEDELLSEFEKMLAS